MKFDTPKVSILVPAYNVEAFISQCLESIINQTYNNLQIVVVDDGSTDGTWHVLREFAAKDSRIEAYYQKNQGVATTRNELIKKVKGDYILFVDSDDWIEPDMVFKLVKYALNYQSDIVMCDRVINEESVSIERISIFELDRENSIKDFLYHNYFTGSLWNKLITTYLIQGLTFQKDIWYGEDALFCWYVLQKCNKVIVTNERLYHYRQNEDSITRQPFGYKKLSGHKVWEIITTDVEQNWPKFYNLCRGAFAKSDYYLLFAAAQSQYPKDHNIRLLQSNLRKNYKFIKPLLKGGFKERISVSITRYWYNYGCLYHRLYNLKIKH